MTFMVFKMNKEEQKTNYQSPNVSVHSLMLDDSFLESRDNGEMGNGGFLDE